MAYSNSVYKKYRHSPNLILPVQDIPEINAINELKPIKEIAPIYGYTSLTQKEQAYNKDTKTFLANYNDPTELNSYIDALTNREAVSKEFGKTWGTFSTTSGIVSIVAAVVEIAAWAVSAFLPDASAIGAAGTAASKGMKAAAAASKAAKLAKAAKTAKNVVRTAKTVKRIAALPSIPAAAKVTYDYGIKPIAAGKPKEALLNTLMNFGETMDYVANPVKGLILEGSEGFIKGLGLSDEGRVNYDYDTGFFLTDMLLELISDPSNWVSFSTSSALKKFSKEAVEKTSKEIVQSAVQTINRLYTGAKQIAEVGISRIQNRVTKTIAKVTQDLTKAGFDNLSKPAKERLLKNSKARIQQSLVRAIRKELPEASTAEITRLLRKAGKDIVSGRFTSSVLKQISNLELDALSTNVIRGLLSIQHYTEAFEKSMTKRAMLTSGYGLGVEVAKNGWKGLKAWANNLTLDRLKKATVFDSAKGLDITQWDKAKNIWEACEKYTTAITGEISQRDKNSFYVFAAQQFNRDKELISNILQDTSSFTKKAAKLDEQFNTLYGCTFKQYIEYLQKINDTENGIFKQFLDYAKATEESLYDLSLAKAANVSTKSGVQLLHAQNVNSIKTLQGNLIAQVQDAIKTSKNKIELTDKFYTIKLNDAFVNAMLLNDKTINETLSKINSSENIGALLNRVLGAAEALAPEANAEIRVAVEVIKNASKTFSNLKQLYDDIARLALPEVPGITADQFKLYIIDQLSYEYKTVPELLAEFDSITLPSLLNNLEVMLYDKGFKVADYPTLRDQIGGVYKRFLMAQQNAGIEQLGVGIVQDFTNSVDTLIRNMPAFSNDLQELATANETIRTLLASVRDENIELLNSLIGDKETIFKIANTRQLADAGLGLKTVAIKRNLDYFNLPEGVSGNVILSANRLGKSINSLKDSFLQYSVYFDSEKSKAINEAYVNFRKEYIDNLDFSEFADVPAFRYLRNTKDPIEQFAQLVEFNKLAKSNLTSDAYKEMLTKVFNKYNTTSSLYTNIVNPKALLVTDFAWEAMAQSAWIAEKQLNESIINGITAYQNLSLKSKKITSDFEAVKELLSVNKLDRPKMLQQERYIKAASKINNMLEFLEQHYASRFNKTIATEKIEMLRNILLNFPELNEKYSALVDTLEAYWRGEKTFQQSPKHLRGTEEFVDEFTPFWNSIKEMNQEINDTITLFNDNVAKGLTESTTQFKYTAVTPWDPVKEQQQLNKLINKASEQNAKGAFFKLFKTTPEQFKNELAYRKRFLTFLDSDINEGSLRSMFENFKKQIDDKEIKYYYDTTTQRHWFALIDNDKKKPRVQMSGRQVYLDGNPIYRLQDKKTYNEFQLVDQFINDPNNPGIVKTLNELEDSLETLTGSRLGDSQGEVLSKDILKGIYEQMPDEIKTVLPDLDTLLQPQFFESYIFNESVLGTAQSKAALGLYAGNVITNTSNAMTQALNYLKPKNEYVHTVFDSQFSIGNPKGIFANFSDQDILEALQANPEYKLVALVDDPKYGMKTREILPTSIKAIQKAKELGAVIIPMQTYKDMYNVVNHRLGSTGMAKLWSRIMYMYKFGYLCRPGAWIRNFIDTNIKSRLAMGDEYRSYKAQAHKILNDVDNMKKFVQQRSKDGQISTEDIKKFFGVSDDPLYKTNHAKYLTYEQYIELERDFLSQGISGNIMADLYQSENAGVWRALTETTGNIIDTFNKTENYNRLAMYLYELDLGLDYTSALSKLAKTHFDYSFKTKAEQLIDMVFPFATFSMRNYSYWVEMLEKHPWLMRNYVHLMKPHWDFKDYTPEELATDYRVQTQILYGQLKLGEFNNKVLTFKANPSIQDAIQMFSDPINNIYEKLAAPISVPLKLAKKEYVQPENIIPVIGPMIQAIKTMSKTDTPLPSAIGIQKAPKRTGQKPTKTKVKFRNKNLSKVNSFKDKRYYRPSYTKNVIYDSYSLKGISRYRANLYPVIDIAHDIRSRYSVNVYNRIKNRVKADVYQGIKYRIRLDANRFR